VFPSSPEAGRDPWSTGPPPAGRGRAPREPVADPESPGRTAPPARTVAGRAPAGAPARHTPGGQQLKPTGAGPDGDRTAARADGKPGTGPRDIGLVPVRRLLSLAVAGFAALLGIGLVFGAQTAGPGAARVPYAVVIFGVQLLFVLAWTMAMRPAALPVVAAVGVLTAAVADVAAVRPTVAALAPLVLVAAAGFAAGVVGQLFRRTDRARVVESLRATFVVVVGVVAFATLIVLTRLASGTQAVVVCLTAAGASLVVARVADTLAPVPRPAPQVPRGALGVVLGAMVGTLAASVLGSYVYPFTPTSGAVFGLVAAGAAGLADLGAEYAEAGRQMAGDPPTMWVARHMQGPLGAFALAAPLTYLMSALFLVPHS
jgi:hypothetical protein